MDGNRRWAKARSLPVIAGHKKGVDALKGIVSYCLDEEIEHLTVYAFSTENWKRNPSELDFLFQLLSEVAIKELAGLRELGVKVDFLGDISRFDGFNIQENLSLLEKETQINTKLNLHIALNYGSVSEITNALNSLESNFSEVDFESKLYTASIPEPDILIRTGGEKRLSNFLLWQSVASSLLFTDTLWPDFAKEELETLIQPKSLEKLSA